MFATHTCPRPARLPRRLLLATLLLAVLGVPPGRGDEITRRIQEELRQRNLYFGDIDGRRTEQVVAALRRYQQRKGFVATGDADETTLRSLTLLPPAPRDVATTAGATPAWVAASSWPDLPILRSDVARRNHTLPDSHPVDADPSPAPVVAPPPSADAAVHSPSIETVRRFLADYLHAGQSDDAATQMPFYAEHVDYLNEGNVDQRFIRADIDGYDRRWPERHFVLLDPIILTNAPDHDPEKIIANFHYRFSVKRPHDSPEGEMSNNYTLQRTGPGGFRIIAMKESRVRRP